MRERAPEGRPVGEDLAQAGRVGVVGAPQAGRDNGRRHAAARERGRRGRERARERARERERRSVGTSAAAAHSQRVEGGERKVQAGEPRRAAAAAGGGSITNAVRAARLEPRGGRVKDVLSADRKPVVETQAVSAKTGGGGEDEKEKTQRGRARRPSREEERR